MTLSLLVLTGLSEIDQGLTLKKLQGTWYQENGEQLLVSEPIPSGRRRGRRRSGNWYAQVNSKNETTRILKRGTNFRWSFMNADKTSINQNEIIWKSEKKQEKWTRQIPAKKNKRSIVGKIAKTVGIATAATIGVVGGGALINKYLTDRRKEKEEIDESFNLSRSNSMDSSIINDANENDKAKLDLYKQFYPNSDTDPDAPLANLIAQNKKKENKLLNNGNKVVSEKKKEENWILAKTKLPNGKSEEKDVEIFYDCEN